MRGVVAHYRELDALVEGIETFRKANLGEVTVYSPTPRHEIEHAVHAGPSGVRRYTLIGGLLGATFGFWIAIWTSRYWPLIVGGKPVSSWVPYVIFGFEVMVLVGALATVFGMFIHSRIPRLTHAVGYDPRFSSGDFGLWVECSPEQAGEVEDLMRRTGAAEVRRER
ncbi:MAG TPA: DUF3341 domain-containing protein [Gemmatimonadaceae bacterium]|nr:DUF3341 domain-containing protein [Gemmatimonadaceae bacterium]